MSRIKIATGEAARLHPGHAGDLPHLALVLDDSHPAASYGLPVLVYSGPGRSVFGPADLLPDGTAAGAIVRAWAGGCPEPPGWTIHYLADRMEAVRWAAAYLPSRAPAPVRALAADRARARARTWIRLPPEDLAALDEWARDENRSLNAQIAHLLREALRARAKEP